MLALQQASAGNTDHSEHSLDGEQQRSRGSCALLHTGEVASRLLSQLDKTSSSVSTGLINISTHSFDVLLLSALFCSRV